MGMTFWIHTLEGRNYLKDSDDHTLMLEHAEVLDTQCDALGVSKLSEYVDYTDQEFNHQVDPDDDDEEPQIDPETELAYGIDEMTWIDAAEGLETLHAIRNEVATEGLAALDDEESEGLLEELDDCIAVLKGPASRGGKFIWRWSIEAVASNTNRITAYALDAGSLVRRVDYLHQTGESIKAIRPTALWAPCPAICTGRAAFNTVAGNRRTDRHALLHGATGQSTPNLAQLGLNLAGILCANTYHDPLA